MKGRYLTIDGRVRPAWRRYSSVSKKAVERIRPCERYMTSANADVDGLQESSAPSNAKHIQEKLHHSLRLCIAAAKKAKAFEVQRSIKRIRAASAGDKHNLELGLNDLKNVDNGYIGAVALRAKLIKARLLPKVEDDDDDRTTSDTLPLVPLAAELYSTIAATSRVNDTSSAEQVKAEARLLSSKALSIEALRAVDSIERLLGKSSSSTKSALPKEEVTLKKDHSEARSKKGSQSTANDGSADKGKSLVVASKVLKAKQAAVKRRLEVELDSSDDRDGKVAKRSRIGDEEALSDTSPTTLPLLSTGFVGGRGFNPGREDADDDDEWSDGDADLDSIDEEVDRSENRREARKNRMGQRARRAIWEKKFGKGANHLKMLQREPRRKSFDQEGGTKKSALPATSDNGWNGTLARDVPTRSSKKPVSTVSQASRGELEMHPSWIAKQQQRQRQEAMLGAGMNPAQKIVFD